MDDEANNKDDDDDSLMFTEDYDDGKEDPLSLHQYYNTYFSNLIMPIVHLLPYSEIDFDLLRAIPYNKPEGCLFWDPPKEFVIRMIFPSRDTRVAAAKNIS